MLLADHAGYPFGVGEAGVFIEPGMTYFCTMLFYQRQFTDCPSRADLTTQGTVKFTVSGPCRQHRTEHAVKPGLQKSGLQGIADTDLNTLGAAYASCQEFLLCQGTCLLYTSDAADE